MEGVIAKPHILAASAHRVRVLGTVEVHGARMKNCPHIRLPGKNAQRLCLRHRDHTQRDKNNQPRQPANPTTKKCGHERSPQLESNSSIHSKQPPVPSTVWAIICGPHPSSLSQFRARTYTCSSAETLDL